MNLLESIPVKQMTLDDKQILLKDKGQHIFLYSSHAHLKSKGDWQIYDEDLGIMVDKTFSNDTWIPKILTGEIDLYYQTTQEVWIVDFCRFKFVFKTEPEARALVTKLLEWRYDTE